MVWIIRSLCMDRTVNGWLDSTMLIRLENRNAAIRRTIVITFER